MAKLFTQSHIGLEDKCKNIKKFMYFHIFYNDFSAPPDLALRHLYQTAVLLKQLHRLEVRYSVG